MTERHRWRFVIFTTFWINDPSVDIRHEKENAAGLLYIFDGPNYHHNERLADNILYEEYCVHLYDKEIYMRKALV